MPDIGAVIACMRCVSQTQVLLTLGCLRSKLLGWGGGVRRAAAPVETAKSDEAGGSPSGVSSSRPLCSSRMAEKAAAIALRRSKAGYQICSSSTIALGRNSWLPYVRRVARRVVTSPVLLMG